MIDDYSDIIQLSEISLYKQQFLNKDFDFITVKDGNKHSKQEECLQYLTDDTTTEIGYGGAAGGAKSWTLCTWIAFMCECYPEVRYFIGREELKRLEESTLITFYKVCRYYGIKNWRYNGQKHFVEFANGSHIDLLDLKYLPSDPLFERYGSIEYTGGAIDEGGETNFASFDTLKSRVGRHLNARYGILRKILVTFNPKKNYVDSYFYRPFVKNELPANRKFVRSLIGDNPHGEKDYLAALQSLTSEIAKQRLLHGNFDYDDDPAALCDYDAICDAFTNENPNTTVGKAISADLAMQGRDRFIAAPWEGLVCNLKAGVDKEKATGKSIEIDLRDLMKQNNIGHSQTVADSDGMGAYLESYLTGIKEFHAGAAAFDNKEFANLKSECGYKLAEVINKREMLIICTHEQQERIKEQLAVLKETDIDADEKRKRIISKEKMKESLAGKSPDYLDMLLMRMMLLVRPKKKLLY